MRRTLLVTMTLLELGLFMGGPGLWCATDARAETPSDLKITTEIKATFEGDHHIDLSDVDVKTENGVVTLSGTVLTDYEKAHAVKHAGAVRDRIKEVKSIVDTITVIFPADQDLVLAKDIRSDLLQNPALHVTKLKVSVQNGSVQLHGFVPSKEQKERVEKIVRGRKQVTSLKNDLVILSEK